MNTVSSLIPDQYFVFTAFSECDKFFYIGTNSGVMQKNKQNGRLIFLTQENSTLPDDHITGITCTRKGFAYIGTKKGLLLWDNNAFLVLNCENSNIPDHDIKAIAADMDDNVWLSTPGAGLFKMTGNTKKSIRIVHVQTNDKKIYSVTADPKGFIWVVFQNGVIEYFKIGNSPTDCSDQPRENTESNKTDNFLIHTNQRGTLLTDGNTFKEILLEPVSQKITCSYFNPKYSRMILCNAWGVNVFSIHDPFSGYKHIPYSEFIRSISCRYPDKKITSLVNQIKECENVQLTKS